MDLQQAWKDYQRNPTPELRAELTRIIESVPAVLEHSMGQTEKNQDRYIDAENFIAKLTEHPLAAFVRFELNQFLNEQIKKYDGKID